MRNHSGKQYILQLIVIPCRFVVVIATRRASCIIGHVDVQKAKRSLSFVERSEETGQAEVVVMVMMIGRRVGEEGWKGQHRRRISRPLWKKAQGR